HYQALNRTYSFLGQFSATRIIYGINTGFGPMVQYRIDDEELNNLQYNLVRSHSTGLGDALPETYARAVLVARLANFLQGRSGISVEVTEKLRGFLNHRIVPEIPEHGGVGASGDLVQLAHLGLNLIGEGFVYHNGERKSAGDVLTACGLSPLKLKLRDGLGIINGTSCMTGIGAVNLIYSRRLLNLAVACSAIINEITDSYDDSFSEGLNNAKQHPGQRYIATEMRTFLSDSGLIRKREELFNDKEEFENRRFSRKIQAYYSLRCVPQILGPVYDTIESACEVIENEINSTNDNPVVDSELENVFHGGNFHGDYVSLEMDKLKLVITKLSMLMERQLNYLMNSRLNEKFPPFLNSGSLGLNFGFQGMQFTATSTTAENQALSTSLYIHSIPNNNDNQDIVSMGTNAANQARKVIDNAFQVTGIHLMALCQAIDLLDEASKEKLGSSTQKIYRKVREQLTFITGDRPLSEEMRAVISLVKENDLI
ncbi:MAG: aromatic amino acid ammonia-lyase, partial [Bacteroidota bacterium]